MHLTHLHWEFMWKILALQFSSYFHCRSSRLCRLPYYSYYVFPYKMPVIWEMPLKFSYIHYIYPMLILASGFPWHKKNICWFYQTTFDIYPKKFHVFFFAGSYNHHKSKMFVVCVWMHAGLKNADILSKTFVQKKKTKFFYSQIHVILHLTCLRI